jgi:hypothetical protein
MFSVFGDKSVLLKTEIVRTHHLDGKETERQTRVLSVIVVF